MRGKLAANDTVSSTFSPTYSPGHSACIRQHTPAYIGMRQHTSAYSAHVSTRQHTSAYVSIRYLIYCIGRHGARQLEIC